MTDFSMTSQGCNHGKSLGTTSAMVGRISPPCCNRVKVSQNLGATVVALVAPAVTSLPLEFCQTAIRLISNFIQILGLGATRDPRRDD